jgi:hypothetical protein
MRWLLGFWYAQQRAFDLKFLWPACCEQAPTLDEAKMVFAIHAYNDPAWLWLENKLYETIDKLEPPK